MVMPNRPRAHQLETISVRKFESLLPANWVYRTPSDDYGIDGEVEIFDKQGGATGRKFLVQLKATDEVLVDKALKLRMEIEKLNYYQALDQPILVVRYLANSDTIYCRWIHTLNPTTDTIAEKSFSMQFSGIHLWSEESITAIEQDLQGYWQFKSKQIKTPFKIALTFSESALASGKSIQLISPMLKAAKDSSVVEFCVVENSYIQTCSFLDIDENELYLSLGKVASIRSNFCLPTTPEETEKCVANIMVSIAYLLQRLGHCKSAEILFEGFYRFSSFIKDLEYISVFFRSKADTNKTGDIFRYLEWLIDREGSLSDELANIIQLMMAVSRVCSHGYREEYQKFFSGLIDRYRALNPDIASILSYNLGNYLLEQGLNRQAVRSYILAAKINPEYRKKEYWIREMAGLMFNIGKYKIAAKLYGECVAQAGSDDGQVIGCFADSLLFSGDYSGALDKYRNALEKKCNSEWSIKAWLIESLIIEQIGLYQQVRGENAGHKVNAFKSEDCAERYLVETNALCPDCWYYLANQSVQNDSFFEAAAFFLLSALIDGAHMDSWANAFKCAIESQNQNMISAVVTCASRRHGSEMITRVASSVRSNDPEFLKSILDIVKISEEIHTESIDASMTLRFGGPNGIETMKLS